jgi:hypothetical protein
MTLSLWADPGLASETVNAAATAPLRNIERMVPFLRSECEITVPWSCP